MGNVEKPSAGENPEVQSLRDADVAKLKIDFALFIATAPGPEHPQWAECKAIFDKQPNSPAYSIREARAAGIHEGIIHFFSISYFERKILSGDYVGVAAPMRNFNLGSEELRSFFAERERTRLIDLERMRQKRLTEEAMRTNKEVILLPSAAEATLEDLIRAFDDVSEEFEDQFWDGMDNFGARDKLLDVWRTMTDAEREMNLVEFLDADPDGIETFLPIRFRK